MYIKPLAQEKNLTTDDLALHSPNNEPSLRYFCDSNSFMQAAGESLQPKTSFWKQTGIYGLEFVGGNAGSLLSGICAIAIGIQMSTDLEDFSLWRGSISYIISNMLITSTCTWGIGKALGQNNSWRKASLGTGIGCFAGITAMYLMTKGFTDNSDIGLGFAIGCPALGAVAGLNIK